jgi:hypothetical protein
MSDAFLGRGGEPAGVGGPAGSRHLSRGFSSRDVLTDSTSNLSAQGTIGAARELGQLFRRGALGPLSPRAGTGRTGLSLPAPAESAEGFDVRRRPALFSRYVIENGVRRRARQNESREAWRIWCKHSDGRLGRVKAG